MEIFYLLFYVVDIFVNRCMFFVIWVNISGLNFKEEYVLVLDIILVDDNRYKFYNLEWFVIGKVELLMFIRIFVYLDLFGIGL